MLFNVENPEVKSILTPFIIQICFDKLSLVRQEVRHGDSKDSEQNKSSWQMNVCIKFSYSKKKLFWSPVTFAIYPCELSMF